MRAGSYLPTQRGTSSASLRAAAPDRRPHTAPDLLPVAYPRSREHDEEPSKEGRLTSSAPPKGRTSCHTGQGIYHCWYGMVLAAVHPRGPRLAGRPRRRRLRPGRLLPRPAPPAPRPACSPTQPLPARPASPAGDPRPPALAPPRPLSPTLLHYRAG